MSTLLLFFLVQAAIIIWLALFVGSDAVGYLSKRTPYPVKRWMSTRPAWFLWLMLLSGIGLIVFSFAL